MRPHTGVVTVNGSGRNFPVLTPCVLLTTLLAYNLTIIHSETPTQTKTKTKTKTILKVRQKKVILAKVPDYVLRGAIPVVRVDCYVSATRCCRVARNPKRPVGRR